MLRFTLVFLLALGACCPNTGRTTVIGSTGGGGNGGSSSGANGGSGGGSSGVNVTTGVPYAKGWPKWHYDNFNSGLSPADTSANNGTLVWKFNVGVPQVASGTVGQWDPAPTYLNSPVVDGSGNVYQLGMDGTFYALGDGGTELWTTTLLPPNPDGHAATPIIAADDSIYVTSGSDNGQTTATAQLYHLDAASGKVLFQAGPPILSTCYDGTCHPPDGFDVPPAIGFNGLLYVADDYSQTATYNLNSDGSFTQGASVSLFLGGERVAETLDQNNNSYWCSFNLCWGVTDPAAGFKLMSGWPENGGRIGSAPPSVADVVGDFVNSDLAYDQAHTGWLIVEAGIQETSTGHDEVVAMDPTNGSLHWDVTLPSGPTVGTFNAPVGGFSSDVGNAAPAIASDGTIYVGNVDGLYALTGTTGAKTWSYTPSQDTGTGTDVDTAPAIGGDGTIFFGTAGGTFYAVKPDGTERFHFTTGGRISSSPAIGPDGTVFFVSDDGYLYALR
jgi:outer membrane protein assembly factor BamB